jgi:hypothetical protein
MAVAQFYWTAYLNADFAKTWTLSYSTADYTYIAQIDVGEDDPVDLTITQGTYTLLFKLFKDDVNTITEGAYDVSVKQKSTGFPDGVVIAKGKIIVTNQPSED